MKYLFLFSSLLFFPFQIGYSSFTDIENSFYKESIEAIEKENIIQGFSDNTFKPRQKITRAEMIKIALETSKTQISTQETSRCFPDIDTSQWYAPYICSAKRENIAKGHNDGNFYPNNPVTVHEALAFMTRSMQEKITNSDSGEWFEGYEEYAEENNIITKNSYNPSTEILRGQVAQIAEKMIQKQKNISPSYLSSGCGKIPEDFSEEGLTINGKKRTFLEFIPSNYDNNNPYGIIVASHGRTNSNTMVQRYMGLEGGKKWKNGKWETTIQNNFIVLYPAGISNGSSFSWHQKENLTFIEALVTRTSQEYCIDKKKIFAVGHSLGGYFTNKLSCTRGDIFRKVGVVGSTPYNEKCNTGVQALIFHHPKDQLVSYKSGLKVLQNKVVSNRCTDKKSSISIFGYQCSVSTECRSGNTVTWCDSYNDTLGGDYHSWPSNSGQAFLEFFSQE